MNWNNNFFINILNILNIFFIRILLVFLSPLFVSALIWERGNSSDNDWSGMKMTNCNTVKNRNNTFDLILSEERYTVSEKTELLLNFDNFDANGPIDKATVDQFSDLYQKQSDKAQAVDAFNGDPLNPLIIGLSEDAELPSQQ